MKRFIVVLLAAATMLTPLPAYADDAVAEPDSAAIVSEEVSSEEPFAAEDDAQAEPVGDEGEESPVDGAPANGEESEEGAQDDEALPVDGAASEVVDDSDPEPCDPSADTDSSEVVESDEGPGPELGAEDEKPAEPQVGEAVVPAEEPEATEPAPESECVTAVVPEPASGTELNLEPADPAPAEPQVEEPALLEPLASAKAPSSRGGWVTEGGVRRYRDPRSGKLLKSGMHEIEGSTYCFSPDGSLVVGWVVSDGEIFYFDPDSGAMATDCAVLIKGLCAPTQAADGTSYADVNRRTPHGDDIAWTYQAGISGGWVSEDGTRTFHPLDTVKRQDMAAFLYRLAGSPEFVPSSSNASFFSDVSPETPHSLEVWWLASLGISEGWLESDGTRTFRPMDTVKRQDMAAFLYRLAGSPRYTPTRAQKKSFTDVNSSTPHAKEVWWLASTGISEGYEVGDTREFQPMSPVYRQDMAAFLHRMVTTDSFEPEAVHEYRFDSDGSLVTGWSNGAFYDHATGARVNTGWVKDGSFTGYIDAKKGGLLKSGVYKIAGSYYIFGQRGNLRHGLIELNGNMYSARSSSGRLHTNENMVIKRVAYHANSNGVLVRSTFGQSLSSASSRQKRIASIAWAEPTTPYGWCAMWVHNVFEEYGIDDVYGNACDLYYDYCTSSDPLKLKVGMIVAVSRHPGTPGGQVYGHIGIYVGDGVVLDSAGEVRVWCAEDWSDSYDGWVPAKWGWYGDRRLG